LNLNLNSILNDSFKFPEKLKTDRLPEGKGLYPIFAIMSHYCVCNARYSLNPDSLMMYVRARSLIRFKKNQFTVKPVHNGHPWDLKKVAV
jgi:hypothetical protein